MKLTIFGATGRTGMELVRQALEAGHQVTAFVRNPAKLSLTHERLRVVQGALTDPAAVARAVEGADLVLNALGPVGKESKGALSAGARNMVAAMSRHGVRRYVGLTGAGVAAPGDPPSLGRTMMLSLLKLLAKDVLEESEAAVRAVTGSDLDWTVVRAPVLTSGALKGVYRTGIMSMGPGARISRADAAHFMLAEAQQNRYVRQLPMITY